ncbi:MAG TPA: PorP/SprF family type IX secretion system membrane protein [Phototrophicaceae bacterium]|nr:PorP/SprF family type IX secretion system membrane protein [Phototrophicaceae bacterium]
MSKYIYTAAVLSFLTVNGLTQDIHFSQYTENIMNINPALAGTANGFLRANMCYRTQWAAFGNPYRTMGFSADAPLIGKKKTYGSYLGAGVNVFQDKAGLANLSKLHLAADLSGVVVMGDGLLSAGIEVAYAQRSINGSGLKWDSQWQNNAYDPSLPSGETASAAKAAFDFGGGLAYTLRRKASTISSNDGLELTISTAAFHFTHPDLGVGGSDPLAIRYTGMIYSTIGITNTNLRLSPRILYNQQSSLREINAGCIFYYVLQSASSYTGYNVESALGVGASYRVRDALIPEIHYYNGSFFCGISYDFNMSKLTPWTASRGGLEVTLRFTDVSGMLWGGGRSARSF